MEKGGIFPFISPPGVPPHDHPVGAVCCWVFGDSTGDSKLPLLKVLVWLYVSQEITATKAKR